MTYWLGLDCLDDSPTAPIVSFLVALVPNAWEVEGNHRHGTVPQQCDIIIAACPWLTRTYGVQILLDGPRRGMLSNMHHTVLRPFRTLLVRLHLSPPSDNRWGYGNR